MAIQHVGVIGCGLMGSGIVQVAAQAGFKVTVVEASDDLLQRGLGRLRQTLEGLVGEGPARGPGQGRGAGPDHRHHPARRSRRDPTSSSRP